MVTEIKLAHAAKTPLSNFVKLLGTNLTSVELPNSVNHIGGNAFEKYQMLESVSLSANLKSISKSLFKNCTNLKNVNIPSGVISIGERAFYNTKLTSLNIPNSVTSVRENTFAGIGVTF